jgi:hypothetical protein
MRGTTTARTGGRARARWFRRAATTAGAGALVAVTALGVPPASGRGTNGLGLSIDPTSGPIGTVITATITGCTAGLNPGNEARLDFNFVGFTPANTVFFVPEGDGTDIVEIEAKDKLPQSAGLTDAEVRVSQCVEGDAVGPTPTGDEVATAPFTVIRPAPPEPTAQPPAAVEATPTFTG